jgi:hypothetical protein
LVGLPHLFLHPLGLFLLAVAVVVEAMALEDRRVTMEVLAAVAHKD